MSRGRGVPGREGIMSTKTGESKTHLLERSIEDVAARANQEFCEVADFIWKTPRLIASERELELTKLDEYFPCDPQSRAIRWDIESAKIDQVFPSLIAMGNLFVLLSLFEKHVLLLSTVLSNHTSVLLADIKGNGFDRLIEFFRKVGIATAELHLHEQVKTAFKIRNCLIHASGVLECSRDSDSLREIVKSGKYLSPLHRAASRKQGGENDDVYIQEQTTAIGSQLVIRNDYCHILCSYLMSYFTELCRAAGQVISNDTLYGALRSPGLR